MLSEEVILGGSFLNFFPDFKTHIAQFFLSKKILSDFSIISDIALGIIAFSIGSELIFQKIKKLGKSIFFIVVCESLGAFLIVFLSFFIFFRSHILLGLLLGAIASANGSSRHCCCNQRTKSNGNAYNYNSCGCRNR